MFKMLNRGTLIALKNPMTLLIIDNFEGSSYSIMTYAFAETVNGLKTLCYCNG